MTLRAGSIDVFARGTTIISRGLVTSNKIPDYLRGSSSHTHHAAYDGMSFMFLDDHEIHLDAGRFEHFDPQNSDLVYDFSLNGPISIIPQMIETVAEMDTPWRINIVGLPKGLFRITIGLLTELLAVELRLRMP